MKYSFRALLAVAMLVGVYVLGLAVVVGLVAIVWGAEEVGASGAVLGKFGLIALVIGFAVLRGLFSRSKRDDGPEPGVAVTPAEQPRLWAEVRELAEQAGTRAPDEIRLIPDVNAAVAEKSKWLGLVRGTRRMYLGVPLLTGLSALQLRSVLAHELGHYSGNHGALSGVVYRGREAIGRVIERLGADSLTGKLFIAYGKLYVRVSHAVNRRQELEADQLSARLVGPRTAASAMREIGVISSIWGFFVQAYAQLGADAGRRPAGLLQGFVTMVNHPERREQLAAARNEAPSEEQSPYDTHPSEAARIRAFEAMPDDGRADLSGPALDILEDPERALARVEEWMFEDSHLLPTSWEDLVAGSGAEQARTLGLALVESAERVEGRTAMLGSVLAALPSERVFEYVRPLLRDEQGDPRPGAVELVSSLVADAVVSAGRARFRLNWGGPMRLVAPDGELLYVTDRVTKAIGSGYETAALEDWLVRGGVSLHHRPSGSSPAADAAAAQAQGEEGIVAAISGIAGSGYRFLLVTNRGLILRKPDWRDRVTAGLHAYLDPQKAMLKGLLKRHTPESLRTDPRSTVLPWADIDRVELGRTVTRQPKLTIKAQGRSELVVKDSFSSTVVGEPYAAMEHFLQGRFQQIAGA